MFFKLNKQSNLKLKTNRILLFAGICFICISFCFMVYELIETKNYLTYRFNDKIASVESTLNNKIADAKHIIYGLGVTISEKSIISNRNQLIELIQNFDPRHGFDEEFSIPLTGITFINASETNIIYSAASKTRNKLKNKDYLDIKLCLEESKAEAFKPQISSLRIGSSVKETILPISMKIVDSNNNFLGTLCSGLIARELNNKLNLHFDSRYLDSIKIIKSNSDNNKTTNKLGTFSLKHLIKANFFNQNIVFTHELQKYPFALKIKLKHSFLKNAIYIFALFSLSIFILFMVSTYLIIRNIKNYYEHPLCSTNKKLASLTHLVTCEDKATILHPHNFLISPFSPAAFSESVNKIIDEYYVLFLERSAHSTEHKEVQKRILNLIFIEQHFMSLQKSKISEEKIYLNKLYALIHEEFITLPVNDFLKQFIGYCSEFYYEIEIKLIIEKQNQKNFTFKQAALIEAIFSILTLILRSSIYDEKISIKTEFIDNNDFPTITVEAYLIEVSNGNNLGWEMGPYYSHTSLLSIYLLAKENKLFFNIVKKENAIFFILEPIAQKVEFYNEAISR